MVKRMKKRILLLMLFFLFGMAVSVSISAVTIKADVRQGYSREKASPADRRKGYKYRYYYYENGKKVKNAWREYLGKRYYFDKKGMAYQAPLRNGFKDNLVTKKIDGEVYGFDTAGRMVVGYKCTARLNPSQCYYFDATGKYDRDQTKLFRNAIRAGKKGDMTALNSLLGDQKGKRTTAQTYLDGPVLEIRTYNKLFQLQVLVTTDGTTRIIYASAAISGF